MVRDLVTSLTIPLKQVHICEKFTHVVKIIDMKVESERQVEVSA